MNPSYQWFAFSQQPKRKQCQYSMKRKAYLEEVLAIVLIAVSDVLGSAEVENGILPPFRDDAWA